jgi:hypothetical protein
MSPLKKKLTRLRDGWPKVLPMEIRKINAYLYARDDKQLTPPNLTPNKKKKKTFVRGWKD